MVRLRVRVGAERLASLCCGARASARARAVGWSKTKVEGSRVPAVGFG